MNTLNHFLLSITLAADFSASQILFQWVELSVKVMHGYAYILTHPGIPSIIQERDLICLTDSALRIQSADADFYVASIDEKIIVKIGPRLDIGKLVPPAFKIGTSGKDYAMWERKE
ncbi:hypothetical protein L3X38_043784 [Prunus dulcis]|uniref:alpha-amylase n=1 Tax=Prunus dulcis TaxID=3755 RepID=A0AAD4UYF3_PRUDU|nr:hypothetical protein L3X38_043784 [Prunus dulcis]